MGWREIVVVVVVLVAVGTGVSGATEPEGIERADWSQHESLASTEASTTESDTGFDRAEFRIHVHADGNATWTFTYERPIENDDEREEFEAFAEEFRTEETELYSDFRDQAHALAGAGENVTDRDMQATDFSRDAAVQQPVVGDIDSEVGVVELSFVWTNFAAEDDGTLSIGDVFDRGLSLTDGQSLVIETGDGIRFESVAPEDGATSDTTLSDSRSVTWTGDREFPDGHPRAVLMPADNDTSNSDDDADGASTDEGGTSPEDDATSEESMLPMSSWVALFGVAAIALAVLSVAVRRDAVTLPIGDRTTDTETSEGGSSTTEATQPLEDDRSTTEAADAQNPELLTDEERIRQLLETNDGRMKQSAIVVETDWSKSKVSMLLSEMESEGLVSKIRVGRENIITLAGDEPDAARSPFDDDT